jgi:hypothetical protein
MKLHFREMIEPTGVWQEEIDAEIKPQHEALVGMLTRHLSLPVIDVDVHRLAFSIIGMAVHFYVGLDVVSNVAPEMLGSVEAIDVLGERLADYAWSMVEGEARRRAGQGDRGAV